jgi:ornithine cyclodeaminase/alanine dehydrogenase
VEDLLYLSRSDVDAVGIDYVTAIELVRESLLESLAGRVELPPKPGVHPRRAAFLHAMPAFAERRDVVGVKWIAGYPDNPAQGLPYITGVIVMSDASTGLPTAVMDAEEITAVRTAAVSALSMQVLANGGFESVALIGCGRQGRAHLAMIASVFSDVSEVRLYDAIEAASRGAEERFAGMLPLRVVDSVREAVDGAAVILTAVAEQDEGDAGAILPEWVAPGALALPLANDFGWTAAALEQCDSYVVDDLDQFQSFLDRGELTRSENIDAREFAPVLASQAPGRRAADERICSLNIGLAVHDVVLASEVERAARARGIGTVLDR